LSVSKVEEIERIIEQLPLEDFEKLSAWVEQRRRARMAIHPRSASGTTAIRDHGAFLNGYSPEDEGIYDDASGR
jgi:hypothetical protein